MTVWRRRTMTCTKLILADQLGSEVRLSANFQKIPHLMGRLELGGPRAWANWVLFHSFKVNRSHIITTTKKSDLHTVWWTVLSSWAHRHRLRWSRSDCWWKCRRAWLDGRCSRRHRSESRGGLLAPSRRPTAARCTVTPTTGRQATEDARRRRRWRCRSRAAWGWRHGPAVLRSATGSAVCRSRSRPAARRRWRCRWGRVPTTHALRYHHRTSSTNCCLQLYTRQHTT